LVLWAFALIYLLVDVPLVVTIRHVIMGTSYPGGIHEAEAISWWNIWNEARSALSAALQLSALGVLIEIADRMRLTAERPADPFRGTLKP
jgi:hypothetical protein